MRYIQPKITATFRAVSAIQASKVNPTDEISGASLSSGAAYKSNE